MTTPNAALRRVREALLMSQDDLARELRSAGARAGQPNSASKRMVQRWESGEVAHPRPAYARALEMVTGRTIEQLGFPSDVDALVVEDGAGGHDLLVRSTPPGPGPARQRGGQFTGVWLSEYDYYSSGRDQTFTARHHVVLIQHGDVVTVRSLPGQPSQLTIDLELDGTIATGKWTEETNTDGYYRGARYHGAIHLIAEPTGRRLAGKWLGFGKDGEVNSGVWKLSFLDPSTSKATLDSYSRVPGEG